MGASRDALTESSFSARRNDKRRALWRAQYRENAIGRPDQALAIRDSRRRNPVMPYRLRKISAHIKKRVKAWANKENEGGVGA